MNKKFFQFATTIILMYLSNHMLVANDNLLQSLKKLYNSPDESLASSYLISDNLNKNLYHPDKIFDWNQNTSWASANNKSINEYILFKIIPKDCTKNYSINNKENIDLGLRLINGNAKNRNVFIENSRIKKAILEIYAVPLRFAVDGVFIREEYNPHPVHVLNLEIKDQIEPQYFECAIKIDTKFNYTIIAKLIIKDIYKGSKFNNACLSEIITYNSKCKKFIKPSITSIVSSGHLETLQIYLEENPELINYNDTPGKFSLLHIAAEKNHLHIVKYLIEKNLNVNITTNFGTTPLFYASAYGNIEIVKYLISKGADVHAQSDDGLTPLLYTCDSEGVNLETIKILVESGADVNIKDKYGKTPLSCVTLKKRDDLILYLKSKGAIK